jgi:putative FmdB family regulatory protein
MPLFDFQCQDCQETFEELLKSADAQGDVRCVKCGSPKVERLLSVFAAGSSRASRPGAGAAPAAPGRSGGCGGGCACHS